MADSSIVSRDYQRASELAEVVSRGVLAVKRRALSLPQAEPDSEELRSALAAVLRAVVVALTERDEEDPASREAVMRARTLLSSELIDTITRMRSGDLTYFVEDVRRAADAISVPKPTLDDAELDALEQIAGAADAEASRVYRRMLRS
jgi:hypothetical protein